MSEFERITASPETLGKFLGSLPCIEGPWDEAFQKQFCSKCAALGCDVCANEVYRNNPSWWLTQTVAEEEGARK